MMYLETHRYPWLSLREAVTEDDSAITVFKYSNFPAVGVAPLSGQNGAIDLRGDHIKYANGVMIAAWGAGGDGKTITAYRLYAVARNNGPIVLLAGGVMTSGSQACAVHPLTGATLTSNFWVDTITVTSGILEGLVEILDSGNNRICMLMFDTLLFDKIFLEYDEAEGEMTEFNAMICGI